MPSQPDEPFDRSRHRGADYAGGEHRKPQRTAALIEGIAQLLIRAAQIIDDLRDVPESDHRLGLRDLKRADSVRYFVRHDVLILVNVTVTSTVAVALVESVTVHRLTACTVSSTASPVRVNVVVADVGLFVVIAVSPETGDHE